MVDDQQQGDKGIEGDNTGVRAHDQEKMDK